LLAFAVCRPSSLAWHVAAVFTARDARRRGIATALLQVRCLATGHHVKASEDQVASQTIHTLEKIVKC